MVLLSFRISWSSSFKFRDIGIFIFMDVPIAWYLVNFPSLKHWDMYSPTFFQLFLPSLLKSSLSIREETRKLLLIYVHNFFASFHANSWYSFNEVASQLILRISSLSKATCILPYQDKKSFCIFCSPHLCLYPETQNPATMAVQCLVPVELKKLPGRECVSPRNVWEEAEGEDRV